MLHQRGLIKLVQKLVEPNVSFAEKAPHLRDAAQAHLGVVLDGKIRLYFDMHDSEEVASNELNICDVYFKRSYSSTYVHRLPAGLREKVIPLGFNYRVLPNHVDRSSLRRALYLRSGLKLKASAIIDTLDVNNLLRFRPRVEQMESLPDYKGTARVLFLVTAYDPYDNPDRSGEKAEERIEINETRAACLRLLRRELGSSFFGGFNRNAYTLATYKDLVVPDSVTRQNEYIKMMKSYPICVATSGLHGSNGWKLAEYIAFGRAILSEPLLYVVPGDFRPRKNYLEFTSPEQCVERAARLLEDRNLRNTLMTNNIRYYQAFLRPDSLILNALVTALSREVPSKALLR